MWPFKEKEKPKPDTRTTRCKCIYLDCKYYDPGIYCTGGQLLTRVCLMCRHLKLQEYNNYAPKEGGYATL